MSVLLSSLLLFPGPSPWALPSAGLSRGWVPLSLSPSPFVVMEVWWRTARLHRSLQVTKGGSPGLDSSKGCLGVPFPGGASVKEPACQCGRRESRVWSLGREDPLKEGMAAHCSILAWRIPWTEEPGGLQSMGSQRVRHHWRDLAHLCLGKETQRVPFKLQGEESSVSITSTLFLRRYALCSPLGPACWQWKRKTEGEFLAKGTAAAQIFNHETIWQGHSFTPSKMRGGGNTVRTREWTFRLNSEWSRAPFTDIFFLVSFWIQLWKLSSWDRVARVWYCGPLPDDGVKNFLAAWAQTFATPWISRWKERKKKRLYSQQLVSVGAEGSAGRFSFTSSMHSGFSKERSVREILSENKMPRLCS